MAFNTVRDYLREKTTRLLTEWKIFQANDNDPEKTKEAYKTADYKRIYHGVRHKPTEQQLLQAVQSELDKIKQERLEKNTDAKDAFQFYRPIYEHEVTPTRLPAQGLTMLPLKYHKGRVTTADETITETGYGLHPLLKYLIREKYPQYLQHPYTYCRPLGTTDATFRDFNRAQQASDPIPEYRLARIQSHIKRIFDVTPYQPLHYVDTQYANLPLSTGTGYHNRHSFKINAHAKYSHPDEYSSKPTSKGYYTNAFHEQARSIIHYIKHVGLPYECAQIDIEDPGNDDEIEEIIQRFYNEYPTILFTRNHISLRNGILKQRPVYAVDDLFLTCEVMLTFPLHVQARKDSCAIMYGLETIRGGNMRLDKLAQDYRTYFTLDWSSFDQTIPRAVTDTFFTTFLPSLLVCNHGYTPTYEYPTHSSSHHERLPLLMKNLLHFIHMWFNNMTYVTADGYAYRRTHAGLPSGLLNTQYLDSYSNLFVMLDSLIEYGLSDDDITRMKFFIMGDDNTVFTHWTLPEAELFVDFMSQYASRRWHMTLSRTKCKITNQRQNIETLSYRCNFGRPQRPIPKLVAQLCYPEHGRADKYMSARAIGIAFAACGSDPIFHSFCKDVYQTFLPYSADLTAEDKLKFSKYLPGTFKLLDEPTFFLEYEHFPTIQEIHDYVHKWHGPLLYTPKWNTAHFTKMPGDVPPDSEVLSDTLARYERENVQVKI